MGRSNTIGVKLTRAQFKELGAIIRSLSGIALNENKRELVKARLGKRLRLLDLNSFDEYIERIHNDTTGREVTAMLDAISTNKTSFFREPDHFDFLRTGLLPRLTDTPATRGRRLRVWSAGCSSGEEPYSIALCLKEHLVNFQQWNAKVLATDISTRVLAQATRGVYPAEELKAVGPHVRAKHFECVATRPEKLYRVNDSLRSLIHFARLNLMDDWPMTGPFDAIFCRNVMIYFDKPTQNQLIRRFTQLLAPGGILFVGHSESLTGVRHMLQYVQPTVYRKPESKKEGTLA